MSIKCIDRVWEHSKAKGSALLVMLAIADYAHDDGSNAYPSIDTLAQKTRMSTRSVQRILRTLQESGELYVEENRGRGNTNVYTVLVKGDNMSPIPKEKVTNEAEKVTNGALKGDTGVTRSVSNPIDPSLLAAANAREEAEELPEQEEQPEQSDLTPSQEIAPFKKNFEKLFGRLPTKDDITDMHKIVDLFEYDVIEEAFQEVARRIKRGSSIARPAAFARHIAQDISQGVNHGEQQTQRHANGRRGATQRHRQRSSHSQAGTGERFSHYDEWAGFA